MSFCNEVCTLINRHGDITTISEHATSKREDKARGNRTSVYSVAFLMEWEMLQSSATNCAVPYSLVDMNATCRSDTCTFQVRA